VEKAVPAGQVLIADLGLAKALAAASGLTARAGTPGYMAPEQDDPLAIVDRRADVYGLGKLGVRLLGVPGRRRPGDLIRLRDGVPRRIAEVLRTATAQRPENRYRDAAAFGAALDRASVGRTRAGPAVLAVGRTAMGLASVGVVGVLASDSIGEHLRWQAGAAVDARGQISVQVPDGWAAATGYWTRPQDAGGQRGPAVVVSPDPARWALGTTVPGAFFWLEENGAATTTSPSAFIAGRPHAGCVAAPMRTTKQAGLNWLIAGYRDCANGRAQLVEAVGTRPGDTELVYAQIAPRPGSPRAFVDTLLAGVRVR
jgi:hypothetical protein